MHVLQVCAEIFPLLKTGGLADVTGALPRALATQGVDLRVLLPGFEPILAGLQNPAVVGELPARAGVPAARLLYGELPAAGTRGYVIDAPELFLRPGGPYADAHQHPFGDNHLRFARLAWAAADLAHGLDSYWRPAVVHAHDWHAGLAPACLKASNAPVASVFTVHNLAYQGSFWAPHFGELGLPAGYFDVNGLEYHGSLNFMKAGLYFADRLTTVSPSYAREIQGPEQGMGLDGLLRSRAGQLHGILNGVDDAVWNPAHDPLITAAYEPRNMTGKARCKAALQARLGLAEAPDTPLFIVVSRLTEQKGLHLVQHAVPGLLAVGLAQLGGGAGMHRRGQAQRGQGQGQGQGHPGGAACVPRGCGKWRHGGTSRIGSAMLAWADERGLNGLGWCRVAAAPGRRRRSRRPRRPACGPGSSWRSPGCWTAVGTPAHRRRR